VRRTCGGGGRRRGRFLFGQSGCFPNLAFENTDPAVQALSRCEHGQEQRNPKKNASEINCCLGQNRRGLSAKNVFCHSAAESRAQPFVLWPLHQYHKRQQDADNHENRK